MQGVLSAWGSRSGFHGGAVGWGPKAKYMSPGGGKVGRAWAWLPRVGVAPAGGRGSRGWAWLLSVGSRMRAGGAIGGPERVVGHRSILGRVLERVAAQCRAMEHVMERLSAWGAS